MVLSRYFRRWRFRVMQLPLRGLPAYIILLAVLPFMSARQLLCSRFTSILTGIALAGKVFVVIGDDWAFGITRRDFSTSAMTVLLIA